MFDRSMAMVLFVSLVCMVGSVWAVVDLQVDIGTDQLHDVKPGWTEWAEPRDDPGPPRADETFGDITVILDVNTFGMANVGLGFRDPDATWPDGYDGPPLVGDGVIVDNMTNPENYNEMYLTIVGLAAGDYTMTTWHNYLFDWPSESVDIEVDGELKVEGVQASAMVADDEEAATATFDFTAPGDANVVVLFISQQPMKNVILNAFHLVSHSQAREPNPADRYPDACPDVVLSWTAGEFAQPVNGHDVYFGTDYDDVNDATTAVTLGVYKGRQSETEYDPPGLLDLGKTYYWRIDEANDLEAESPLKGTVWSFTINEGENFGPDPRDGATLVPVDSILSWSSCGAGTHKVYFSTDFNDVNDRQAGAYKGQQSETTWDPCGMEYYRYYYWAVDKIEGPNNWPGPVWSFRTESAIVDPNMILWFEFSETEGEFLRDSSGYEHYGIGDDFDDDTWDPNDGRYPGCIDFDGGERVDAPWSTLNNADDGITISVWIKGAMGDENYLISAGDDGNNVWLLIPTADLQDVEWRAGNDTNDTLLWREADPSAWVDDWHHLGLLKDENAGTMEIYFDGVKVKSKTGTSRTLASVGNKWFKVGCRWNASDGFEGRIDELRIYDYALGAMDIASLYRGSDVGTAWAPSPSHGQTDVLREVVLNWRPGNYADSHDVYFGTDWDDVNDADTNSGVYIDNREPNEYDPDGSLAFGTTYYWRIDEVNDSNSAKWKGKVWLFTVANFIVVDSFESYDSATNKVFDTWEDGIINYTGSTIDLGVDPFDPTHAGNQSMLYVYDNTIKWDWDHYWSEAKLPFDSPQDFTDGGVKVLTIYFYGSADNDANDTEELYVGLTGSLAEVRYSDDHGNDNNDLKLPEWTEWNIPLSDFSGVDPCAVTGLLIGFGDRDNTDKVGGEGVVFFDEIRLYPPRCVPELRAFDEDLSGPYGEKDCIINYYDVGAMADQWLRTDACLPTTLPSPGPVAHWQFEEGDSNNVSDSANSHHGVAEGAYAWVEGKIGSWAMEFSGGRVLVPDHAQLRPQNAVSATAWVFISETQDESNRVVVKGADNAETYALQVNNDDEASLIVRDSDPCGPTNYNVATDDIYHNEWMHLAGVCKGDTNTLNIYVNGQLAESANDANFMEKGLTLSQDTNDLAIGNRSDDTNRRFLGKVDDIRVYDYPLSAAEVAYIATEGTGYVALASQVNIYDQESAGQKAINIRDVAELLNSWLVEKLWPQ